MDENLYAPPRAECAPRARWFISKGMTFCFVLAILVAISCCRPGPVTAFVMPSYSYRIASFGIPPWLLVTTASGPVPPMIRPGLSVSWIEATENSLWVLVVSIVTTFVIHRCFDFSSHWLQQVRFRRMTLNLQSRDNAI